MKNLFTLTAFLLLGATLQAQSLADAKKAIYYDRYTTAATTLDNHLKAQPGDAEAWYWLANTYAEKEAAAEGLYRLRTAPADVQGEPFYKAALGHLLLSAGNKDSATLLFNQALDGRNDRNAELVAAVARAHVEAPQGDANEAIALLGKAIKRDKNNPAHYVLLGDAYRKLNNGSEAYKAYKDALDKDANYAAAHYRIGKIFVTQKNPVAYLPYFNDAIAKDPNYAPAYYELYSHYFATEPAKAMTYFKDYQARADADADYEYALTDLLYMNKDYDAAIAKARQLMQQDAGKVQPRLYKLLAYSYEGQKDTATALGWMQQYFAQEADSNLVLKDYETMGNYYAALEGKEDSAAYYYTGAIKLEQDSTAIYAMYKKMADLYKNSKNFASEADWRARFYTNNAAASNLDLFNWGLAHYRAEEFAAADSVFGLYVTAYPDQSFGYYWQARAAAGTDPEMATGAAIPRYQKLVDVLQQAPELSETDKRWMVEAYGYLAAYETNTEKDYAEAVSYFEKVLELDPENSQARKYIEVLEKNISASEGSK